jgi:hypothetical protein
MTYTFADELISDLHKDAHGMRPSAAFMDAWHQTPMMASKPHGTILLW